MDAQGFAFFTSFDDFHFIKPRFLYYAGALGRLGWSDSPIIMVGDNFKPDIQPMKAL